MIAPRPKLILRRAAKIGQERDRVSSSSVRIGKVWAPPECGAIEDGQQRFFESIEVIAWVSQNVALAAVEDRRRRQQT